VTWREDVDTVRSRLVPKWARQEGTERAYQSAANAALARLEERLERYEQVVAAAENLHAAWPKQTIWGPRALDLDAALAQLDRAALAEGQDAGREGW